MRRLFYDIQPKNTDDSLNRPTLAVFVILKPNTKHLNVKKLDPYPYTSIAHKRHFTLPPPRARDNPLLLP